MSFSRWQKLSDRMIAKVVLLAWAVVEGAGWFVTGAAPAAIVLSVIRRFIRGAENSGHRPRANLTCSFSSPPIGGEENERFGTRHTLWRFLFFRFLTGAGIGGEYSAINSAIQELIPARLRGRTDLAINGSFWIGAAVGALVSVPLLDPELVGPDLGWRIAFGSGAVLGLFILYLRRFLPESPRWLMIHGRDGEARKVMDEIEARVMAGGH